jgi:hypothetical protein
MLSWLYDIFVAIVSFVMGLFGFDLKKRSVTFADDVKEGDDTTETAVVANPDVEAVVASESNASEAPSA